MSQRWNLSAKKNFCLYLFFTHLDSWIYSLPPSPLHVQCIHRDSDCPGRGRIRDNPEETNRKPWERSRSVSWFLKLIEKKFALPRREYLETRISSSCDIQSFRKYGDSAGIRHFTIHLHNRVARTNVINICIAYI